MYLSIFYHAYTVWLFTRSDLKTILLPVAVSAILNSTFLLYDLADISDTSSWRRILCQAPRVFLWLWLNLLPFNIDNQRRHQAVLEDKLNKPWRPMPSGRMAPLQAKFLMFSLYCIALGTSMIIGGAKECLALMILGFYYNELKLADKSWVSRNAVNALGFISFASGALEVALFASAHVASTAQYRLIPWLCITSGVIFSTVQTQDMADQAGDRLRGRKTMPLALGDGRARWLTSASILIWSLFCPAVWGLGNGPFLVFGSLGIVIASRLLIVRDISADERTFRLWNAWIVIMYSFPLLSIAL